MSGKKNVTCHADVYADLIRRIPFDQHRVLQGEPITKPLNAIRHHQRPAIGLHVNEFRGEIRIVRRSRYVQAGANVAGDLDGLRKRLRSVHEHIRALLDSLLVQWTGGHEFWIAAYRSAGSGHRVARIINELIRAGF